MTTCNKCVYILNYILIILKKILSSTWFNKLGPKILHWIILIIIIIWNINLLYLIIVKSVLEFCLCLYICFYTHLKAQIEKYRNEIVIEIKN